MSSDLEVQAGSIIFVLATRDAGLIGMSRPLPHPINCQKLTNRDFGGIGWQYQISLAPELVIRAGLAGDRIRVLCLSLCRYWTTIHLTTASIVVVVCSKKIAPTITSFPITGPLKDIYQCLVVVWLGCPEHENCATHRRFAGLCVRKANVAILEILHGDSASWSNSQPRIIRGLRWTALCLQAKKIRRIDASTAGTELWNEVVLRVEAGISASYVATRISVGAGVCAVTANERQLLNPSMCNSEIGTAKGEDQGAQEA